MSKCANPDCECEACDCGDNCTCDKDHKCHEGCHCGETHDDTACQCYENNGYENHADKKGGKSDAKCACSDGQDGTCRCSGKKGKK